MLCIIALFATKDLYISDKIIVYFTSFSEKVIPYQIFYTVDEDAKLDATYYAQKNAISGKRHVSIEIPAKFISKFRLVIPSRENKIKISPLTLEGKHKVVTDLNDYQYFYYESKEDKDGFIEITSGKGPVPYLLYKGNINLEAKTVIDWHLFIILATFYFFIIYKVVKYLAKFKIEKNYSRIDIVFLSVFFALLFAPMLKISDAEKSIQENRMLAKKPQLKDVWPSGTPWPP